MRADLERAKRGLPVDATPLLPAGATQVLDRPPAHATEVLPPTEPERRTNWVPIVVTLVLIALLGALLWFLAANVLNNDDQQTGVNVTVPDVVGKSRTQAEQELTEAGLEIGTITRVPAADDTQQPGTVVEQDPAANTEVERETAVDLTIVAAPDQVAIPSLEGSSLEEAQATLTGLGLEPAGPQEEPSDTIDAGLVTRTDPASGTDVDPGSQVTIFVSAGPDQVPVPEVRCQSFGSAQNELDQAGLSSVISSETVPINPACPLGNKVAAQDPAPGTQVDPGTTVTLFPGVEGTTGPTGGTGETGG
jgi:serine/threonine-protein kinase